MPRRKITGIPFPLLEGANIPKEDILKIGSKSLNPIPKKEALKKLIGKMNLSEKQRRFRRAGLMFHRTLPLVCKSQEEKLERQERIIEKRTLPTRLSKQVEQISQLKPADRVRVLNRLDTAIKKKGRTDR